LFDQNISHRILKSLDSQYESSSTVKKEGLINAQDKEIWDYAKLHNFIIVTQDADFNDLNFLYGFPPKIIWLRTGNLTTKRIAEILDEYAVEISNFIENKQYGCFEITFFKSKD
jgi:predicted nuclease of predicted toxin-antitoxin system